MNETCRKLCFLLKIECPFSILFFPNFKRNLVNTKINLSRCMVCLTCSALLWLAPIFLSHVMHNGARLSKSHAKTVWGPQNLPKDRRFCRSPNSLRMGFTFLMDANTSKVILQLFYGSEANSNKPLKNEKKTSKIGRLVLPFPDT